MRIGFDAKRIFHNSTGLGNYSRDLVRILDQFYPKNTYYLYNPTPKKVTRLIMKDTMKEVLPTSFLGKKFSSLWRQYGIIHQIKKDQVDIFHGLSGEIPRRLKKYNVKSVVTIHDVIFMRYPQLYSYFDRKIYFNKFKYAAENTNKILAVSEQTKRDIVEFLKIDPNKITVIYQGCHATFKEKKSQDFIDATLQKYNLPQDFIVNVGTIEARKNVLSLIKAIRNIDIPLVVIGRKTSYFKEVSAYVEQQNLVKRIYFLEGLTLDEISALYQKALLFSYPSIFEGFGIPIIEALYSKTPVITSKGRVFPEAGGENSIYVNPENTAEFTHAITQLLNDSNRREQIAKLGFNFVQKFNDEAIAKNISKVYEKIN